LDLSELQEFSEAEKFAIFEFMTTSWTLFEWSAAVQAVQFPLFPGMIYCKIMQKAGEGVRVLR
jgi:hypothetical protein